MFVLKHDDAPLCRFDLIDDPLEGQKALEQYLADRVTELKSM